MHLYAYRNHREKRHMPDLSLSLPGVRPPRKLPFPPFVHSLGVYNIIDSQTDKLPC